jgi:hypothetical protein
MPAVICLAGPATAQKRQLLRDLAEEFGKRGLGLGLVTEASEDPGPAVPALEVGSGGVSLRWPGNRPASQPISLDEIVARHFPEADLVLSELVQEGRVTVELVPAGAQPCRLAEAGLKALVSPAPLAAQIPCFVPEAAGELAAWLLEKALPSMDAPPPASRPGIRILVGGQRLPANDFVRQILENTVRAMIGSLKGGDRSRRLEIHLY